MLLVPIPYVRDSCSMQIIDANSCSKCSAVYENQKKTTCRYCFYDAEGTDPQPFKYVFVG